VIGGGTAELAELYIDMSWSRYVSFNLTIDRLDQGRVACCTICSAIPTAASAYAE